MTNICERAIILATTIPVFLGSVVFAGEQTDKSKVVTAECTTATVIATTETTTVAPTTTTTTTLTPTTLPETTTTRKSFAGLSRQENHVYQIVIEVLEDYPDIDDYVIMGMIYCESTFNQYAESGDCKGYMQVNEYYAKDRMRKFGVSSIYSEYGNIKIGIDELNEYYQKYGSYSKALACYNLGEYGAKSQGFPTRYSSRVLSRAEYYKEIIH